MVAVAQYIERPLRLRLRAGVVPLRPRQAGEFHPRAACRLRILSLPGQRGGAVQPKPGLVEAPHESQRPAVRQQQRGHLVEDGLQCDGRPVKRVNAPLLKPVTGDSRQNAGCLWQVACLQVARDGRFRVSARLIQPRRANLKRLQALGVFLGQPFE